MKMNTTRFVALSVFGICLAMTSTSHATLITGLSAAASSTFAPEDVSDLVDPANMNASNEHLSSVFGGGANWLSGDGVAAEQWVYVDLGADYDVDEVRFWNYNSASPGSGDVNGRGVDAYELFVGTSAATLPAGVSATAFGAGWTSVTMGNLDRGPSSDPAPGPYALTANNTISLTSTAVRYIGIQMGSRHSPDPFTTDAVGLGQIQVSAIPEPSIVALLGLGSVLLVIRRCKH